MRHWRQADEDRARLRRLEAQRAGEDQERKASHDELQHRVLSLEQDNRQYLSQLAALRCQLADELQPHVGSSALSHALPTGDTASATVGGWPCEASVSACILSSTSAGSDPIPCPRAGTDDGALIDMQVKEAANAAAASASSQVAAVSQQGSWWSRSEPSKSPRSFSYKKGLF